MKTNAISYSQLSAFELCPRKLNEERNLKNYPFVQNDAATYGLYVHKAFEDFLAMGIDLPHDLSKFQPMLDKFRALPGQKYIEHKMGADRITGGVGFWEKAAWTRCIVDYMKVDADKALVVDWKTGRYSDTTDQLTLAALITMANFPLVNTVRGLYWYKKTSSTVSLTVTRHDALALWAGYTRRFAQLQKARDENNWLAKPCFLCRKYCPVKTCEYYGG